MKLFYTEKPIVGLDISSTGIKMMSIDPKHWTVHGYGAIDLDPGKIKAALEGNDPSFLSDNIKTLVERSVIGSLASDRVVIGVPTARSYSRTFTLPISAEKNIEEAVTLEADQYIPIPSSTLYIDYQIIGRTKDEITVLMSAVARVIVDNAIAAAEQAKLQPILIEPGISAVGRVLTLTEGGDLPTVIVDIGPASTDVAVLDQGTIRVTGGVAIGGNTFTLDIAKQLGVTLENAHQLKILNGLDAGTRQVAISSALQPSLERVIGETRKVIRYYEERISDTRKLEQLLIVGSGSNLAGIGEYFTNALVMPARVASPWQKLDFGTLQEPARQFRSRYITVAGLASLAPGDVL